MTNKTNPLLELNENMDFSGVKAENIKEAIIYYIAEVEKSVESLVLINNPTWDNVYKDSEKLDIDFSRMMSLIGHIKGVKNQKDIEKVYEECIPLLIAHSNKISQDKRLFTIYKSLETPDLSEMQSEILKRSLKSFLDSGINLPVELQEELNVISERLSENQNTFTSNIIDSVSEWSMHILDKVELDGLPPSVLESLSALAKEDGKEGYVLKLQQPY